MSEIRARPSVRDTFPLLPNEEIGVPVWGSREKSRYLLFRKRRSGPPRPSRQNAVPRSFHPLPDRSGPSSSALPSNRHFSLPVSASTAATLLYGVVTYSTPSIMSGVLSKKPGAGGVSQCFHSQATCSRCTFCGPISVSGEYFVPP